jgi:Meckel syndrome type 1 protein
MAPWDNGVEAEPAAERRKETTMAKTLDWKVAVAGGALLGVGIGGFALADAEPGKSDIDDLRLRDAPPRADVSADSPLRSPASTTVTVPGRDDLQSSPDTTSTTVPPPPPTAPATAPPPPPVPATEDSPEPPRAAPAPPPPAPPPAPPPPAPAPAPPGGDSPASPASADSVSASD